MLCHHSKCHQYDQYSFPFFLCYAVVLCRDELRIVWCPGTPLSEAILAGWVSGGPLCRCQEMSQEIMFPDSGVTALVNLSLVYPIQEDSVRFS